MMSEGCGGLEGFSYSFVKKYIKNRKTVQTLRNPPKEEIIMNPYKIYSKPKFDFKNPNDFKKLEKMAYDMTIDISDFPPAAYRYFDKLRTLYAEYKFDNLPEEIAKRRKDEIYSNYKEALSAYELWCKLCSDYQDNIRKAGTMLSDIEKSNDVKDIAVLACEVIGIMMGDENFAPRQKKKITGGIHE